MNIMAGATIYLAITTIALGIVLVRAAKRRRAWFMAIDPALSDHPLLFWWCVFFTMLAFLGGLFGTVVLAGASL